MGSIKVYVKAYPILKDFVEINVSKDTRLIDLIGFLNERYPEFREHYMDNEGGLELGVVVLVNSEAVRDWELVLRDGDKVLFIPPVAGG